MSLAYAIAAMAAIIALGFVAFVLWGIAISIHYVKYGQSISKLNLGKAIQAYLSSTAATKILEIRASRGNRLVSFNDAQSVVDAYLDGSADRIEIAREVAPIESFIRDFAATRQTDLGARLYVDIRPISASLIRRVVLAR